MLLAKKIKGFNVRKIQKITMNSGYEYCIFEIYKGLKLSKDNINVHRNKDNYNNIGVFIKDTKRLDLNSNTIAFNKKKAVSIINKNKIIFQLKEDDASKTSYSKWINFLYRHILNISPYMIMIPIDSNKSLYSKQECDKVVQELNVLLYQLTINGKVVIYQKRELISSLAYIVQTLAFPANISLCIDIDFMESTGYSLSDIKRSIVKYNILNSVSMIKTNKYTIQDIQFKKFLTSFNDDVIVFGENI